VRARRLSLALLALAAASAGCGGEDPPQDFPIAGGRLTVYSSQPLSGTAAARGRDLALAQEMALRDAGARAGRWAVALVPLDSAGAGGAAWSAGAVEGNARRAVRDRTAIAYLGEAGAGASAVAIPILNRAGILTVSALDGLTVLTRRSAAGAPERHYPTGVRSFGRLVPTDAIQAAAIAHALQDLRVRSLLIARDDSRYGRGLASEAAAHARRAGVRVAAIRRVDPRAADPLGPAGEVRRTGAEAFLYAGLPAAGVPTLFRAVAERARRGWLLAPSALAEPGFAARLGPASDRTYVTAPMLPARVLPAAARDFEARFRRAHGRAPDPAAVYGYESMAVVLDSIRRAGAAGNRRRAVIAAFLRTRARASVLGTYGIDGRGDTTARTYGLYRVRGGRLSFERVLDPLGF
jgi:branched-chain amino acid transport system substrate-binding protein